jgi:hypothetical protein
VPPYFRERADWQHVSAILQAAVGERLKFERAWIMRVSKGAHSLAQVREHVQAALEKAKGPELQGLLRPYPAEAMTAYPVDTRVNSVRHNDVACVAPLAV